MKLANAKTGSVISLLLAMALVFSACGSGGGNAGGSAASPDASQAPSGQSASPSASESSAAPALEPVTLSFFVPGVPQKDQQLVNDEISKYLKDKINVKLELEVIDWGSWQDKMQLKFASNEQFDMFLAMSWDNFLQKVTNNLIIPLDDLMAEYAQEAVDQLDPKVLKGVKVDGKTYGFPTNKEFAGSKGVLLRKDMVDKYNFDIGAVKEPRDLEPFFQVIKEKEPGMIPFLSGKDVGLNIAVQEKYFSSAGAVGKNLGTMDRYSPDRKLIDIHADPRYIDILKLSHEWYKKGYINQDAPTLSDFAGTYRSGKVFAFSDSLKPGKDAEVSAASGYEWVQIELSPPLITTSSTRGNMISISRTSKNPERAMMFINLLHTDKTLVNMIAFGLEGKHYVKVGENTIDYPDGVNAQNSGYALGAPYMFGNQFNDYLWANEDPQKWEKFAAFNDAADESKDLGFVFDNENVKNELAAYNNKIKELLPGLITGAVDPDVYLPKMVEELKAAGMDKINDEIQKQFEAWVAKGN